MGVIYLKKIDYDNCINVSNKALDLVNNFQNETKSFASNSVLEVKILLRRAKSYEMREDWELAKEDLDKVLLMEPQNSEARSSLKVIQAKLDDVMFNRYREEGNEFLK